jgi:hypothetical protein
MKTNRWTFLFALPALLLGLGQGIRYAHASDHDDGETDIKGRNVNLTDLYAFREDWQTGNTGDRGNLILIMNSNPRSLPQQQYYFSTTARYELHLSQIGTDNTAAPTAKDNVTLRFEFDNPDNNDVQGITLTELRNGKVVGQDDSGRTTPLGKAPLNNPMNVGNCGITVFAGHREYPFFFDVEAFFKFRAAAASGASAATALSYFAKAPARGNDFTAGYNVNAIVARVPIACIQSSNESVFDIWETISIPK